MAISGLSAQTWEVSPTTIRSRILKVVGVMPGLVAGMEISFTHNDPFEDTERRCQQAVTMRGPLVSPTTIRSRILKDAPASTTAP